MPFIIVNFLTIPEYRDPAAEMSTAEETGSPSAIDVRELAVRSLPPATPEPERRRPAIAESPEEVQRLKAKNRRKRYLEMHPEYFGKDLELADPLLYDRLIRRFQTAAERQAEAQENLGFSHGIMREHLRAQAREEALRNPNPYSMFTYARGADGDILPEEPDEVPENKEEGRAWWVDEMTQRFLRGDDKNFDYKTVDDNDKYDDPEEERDLEEAYFDSMEPYWDGEERELQGETGIQDY
jgi:hypothetical protein